MIFKVQAAFWYLAERKGFEPSIRYSRIHAFQACDLNHSSTSLWKGAIIADDETIDKDGMLFCKKTAKNNNKYNSIKVNYCEYFNFKKSIDEKNI